MYRFHPEIYVNLKQTSQKKKKKRVKTQKVLKRQRARKMSETCADEIA